MYENVEFNFNNFCIGALVDTYCSIDTTNAAAVMQVKTNTGQSQGNYTLTPTITQGVSVKSIEYIGPRSTSSHADGMPFWTLERSSSTQCVIRQWELNDTLNRILTYWDFSIELSDKLLIRVSLMVHWQVQ